MDVIRDRSIVELNSNNVRCSRPTSRRPATVSRSATSPAPTSPSRKRACAGAPAARLAQGNSTSEENYRRVIGTDAGAICAAAAAAAAAGHARRGGADRAGQQSRPASIDRQAEPPATTSARAGRGCRPCRRSAARTISTLGTADDAGLARSGTATSVGVSLSLTIPIYQGGLPAARIRQAQAIEGQLLEQRVATERLVVANPAPPSPLTRRRSRRSVERRRRSTPTSSRSKAPAPSRPSAPATSSTCSTPSRSCSTRRSRW